MEQKRYGHFDDQHREYVITDPQTPWPWINYLGKHRRRLQLLQGCEVPSYHPLSLQQRTDGQRWPLLLHQGRRYRVESGLEAL